MPSPTYASRRPNATAKKFTSKDQKPPKVWFADVWQRTSKSGGTYMFGYAGHVAVLGFIVGYREDGEPVWRLYLQQNHEPPAQGTGTAEPRTEPKPEQTAEDEPFFDDELPPILREPVR